MKNEFLTRNQSIALHELGFDENCLAFYNGKFLDSTEYDFDNGSIKDIGQCVQAPLKSQAFRFFRNKYNLQSHVSFGLVFSFVINNIKYEDCPNYEDNWFRTYEEAESKLIDKLIEIAKK